MEGLGRRTDDFVIYVKTSRAGERVMASVKKYIEEELGLTINEKKSKVCGATIATFLGFKIQNLMGKLDADLVNPLNNNSKIN